LCDEWQYTYECQTQAAVTKEQVVCGDASFDPALMPTPSNPNSTFAQAAVAVEILHEAATYNNNGLIFGGVAESCTKDNTGIHACCDSAPGGKSNSQVASIILGNGASTVKYVGSAAIDWASPYIFDAMYNNSLWTDGLINSFSNGEDLGTNLSSGGFSLSAYGFTYSTTMPAAVDGFTGGDVIAGNSSTGYLSFNVYVFAAMVVIAIVQDMMSCTDQEQLLAVHKGSDLSAFISEECTNTGAFGCSMKTDYFCSFNSVLARIINIQGKTQLGLNIADCQGITTAQLSQIDFSKINFSDFTRSMVQNAQNNTPTNTSLGDGYTPILQTTTQGSSQKTNSATLPAYP
jgi:conjugal transfer mating pair stabilization protein TraN